jgi:WD40 repeat protein
MGMFKKVLFIFTSITASNIMCMDHEQFSTHYKSALIAHRAQTLIGPVGYYPCYATSLSYNPHNLLQLAAGSQDSTIRIWDLEQLKCVTQLKNHREIVSSIAYNPAHQQLASGSHDTTITLWNSQTDKVSATLTEHTGRVHAVAYTKDGSNLISGGDDQTFKIWDPETVTCIKNNNSRSTIRSIAGDCDDSRNVTIGLENGNIIILDIRRQEPITTIKENSFEISGLSYHPYEQTITSVSVDGTVIEWDLRMYKPLSKFELTSRYPTSIAHHPRGKGYAIGSINTVTLFDSDNSSIELPGHFDFVKSIVFNQDGSQIASCSRKDDIIVWDLS